MVTDCHTPPERAKVQGFNDFTIFGVTTAGSLLAGVMLARVGWSTINGALMPVAMLCIVAMGLLLLAERRSPAPQP
jgi:MFS family permease